MIQIHTELGDITISNRMITAIAGDAASRCFGVKGLAVRSVSDGLVHLLRREALHRGVHVTFEPEGAVSIDLHIMVESGINIPAISSAIVEEVSYNVQRMTGAKVSAVRIYVDSIVTE